MWKKPKMYKINTSRNLGLWLFFLVKSRQSFFHCFSSTNLSNLSAPHEQRFAVFSSLTFCLSVSLSPEPLLPERPSVFQRVSACGPEYRGRRTLSGAYKDIGVISPPEIPPKSSFFSLLSWCHLSPSSPPSVSLSFFSLCISTLFHAPPSIFLCISVSFLCLPSLTPTQPLSPHLSLPSSLSFFLSPSLSTIPQVHLAGCWGLTL